MTRPDLLYPVNLLARRSGKVTKTSIEAAKSIMRYLAGTIEEGLFYSPSIENKFKELYSSFNESCATNNFTLFTDASFCSDPIQLRSQSGAAIYYKGTCIAWRSARQTVTAFSTMESEYCAVADGLIMTSDFDMNNFLNDGDLQSCPIMCDNSSAIQVAKSTSDGIIKPRNRHIALRMMRVAEAAARIGFCPTELMRADGLTKCPSSGQLHILLHLPLSNSVNIALEKLRKNGKLYKEDCGYFSGVPLDCFLGFFKNPL
jgi:hypothetical protein